MGRLVHHTQDRSGRTEARFGICRNERAQPLKRELPDPRVLNRRDALQSPGEFARHFKGYIHVRGLFRKCPKGEYGRSGVRSASRARPDRRNRLSHIDLAMYSFSSSLVIPNGS